MTAHPFTGWFLLLAGNSYFKIGSTLNLYFLLSLIVSELHSLHIGMSFKEKTSAMWKYVWPEVLLIVSDFTNCPEILHHVWK